jgi:hypothetical protein
MPPKIDERSRRLNVIMPEALVKKIDDWRRHQPELPNISEAIRRLCEIGVEAAKKRGVNLPLTDMEPKPRRHKAAKL